MKKPIVTVIVITYRRLEALKRTLHSFFRHIDVDNYEVIICDDGSSDQQRREIERLGADKVIWNDRAGYGISVNSGIRAARGEFLFHLEDDLVVVPGKHFIQAGVEVLRRLPELGCLKYEYEGSLPKLRARRQVGPYGVEVLPFPNANAKGYAIFCYGNRPHLKSRKFHQVYGWYPEGYDVWTTELLFVARVNRRRGPRIGWIRDSAWFWHVGPHYGTTGHDPLRATPIPYDPDRGLTFRKRGGAVCQ